MSEPTKRRIILVAASLALAIGAAPPSFAGANTAQNRDRAPFTAGEIAAARPAGLQDSVRISGDDPKAFQALIAAASAAGDPWLVLSGGGEDGAFGAGLLAGWSAAGTRPAFGVITGVSTGALIAPFAFIGQAGDAALREAYTQVSASDVFEFGGTDEALTDTWPLKRRIERAVTPRLMQAVAAEHAKGRRLLVATTEIDTGRPVLWDMGAIAAAAARPDKGQGKAQEKAQDRALDLFRAIVLASAAVPGVFPPVAIESSVADARTGRERTIRELHVDGGTTAPFYLAPKAAQIAAVARRPAAGLRIPAHTVYLVVNNSLAPDFAMASRSVLGVLGRTLSAAIRAQTEDALALAGAFARQQDLDLRVARIDERFGKTSSAPFDQRYMQALFAHAERLGLEGTAFAEPEGAALGDVPTGSVKAPTAPDAPKTLAVR